MTDIETVQEKLEYEIFSEQCAEQAKDEEMIENKPIIDGVDVSECIFMKRILKKILMLK